MELKRAIMRRVHQAKDNKEELVLVLYDVDFAGDPAAAIPKGSMLFREVFAKVVWREEGKPDRILKNRTGR